MLDAPALSDDYYLNLVDWSNSNELAVGLGNSIYLWNGTTLKVSKLCEIFGDSITSVSWSPVDPFLSVGCDSG